MKEELLKELYDLDKEFKIHTREKEITTFLNFNKEFWSPKSRFGMAYPAKTPSISMRYYGYTIMNLTMDEFYPCCGKAIYKHLALKENYGKVEIDGTKYFPIDPEKLEKAFRIFMEICDEIVKYGNYSSVSAIISTVEQAPLYKYIQKIDRYKEINSFRNERMVPVKNLCVEYCRNLW